MATLLELLDVNASVLAKQGAGLFAGLIIGYTLGLIKCCLLGPSCPPFVESLRKRARHMNEQKSEKGILRRPIPADILFLIITIIVVYGVVVSQKALNETERAQSIRTAENMCTSSTLFATVEALNQRTQFTTEQAKANIQLQKAQLPLIQAIAAEDGSVGDREGERIVVNYLEALTNFLTASTKAVSAGINNPYPTLESYLECLAESRDAEVD